MLRRSDLVGSMQAAHVHYLYVEGKVGHIHSAEGFEAIGGKPKHCTVEQCREKNVVFPDGLQLLHGVHDGKRGPPYFIRVWADQIDVSVVQR